MLKQLLLVVLFRLLPDRYQHRDKFIGFQKYLYSEQAASQMNWTLYPLVPTKYSVRFDKKALTVCQRGDSQTSALQTIVISSPFETASYC